MKKQNVPSSASDNNKLIVRGVHLDLTDALRAFIESKCERLLRHQARIIRIRVDLEYDKLRKGKPKFLAKGLIEISGPDMVVTMESDDAYKAIDLMSQKLDRLLRVRASAMKKKKLHPRSVDLEAELPKVSATA
ncbi:putative sigma-54 modulation protein [Ereboglobus sp. PH5-5]|uniref:ribosome hibernation-promoting factor, HPF/YfiA family n=1 Tax=unclassified Ereboglobus TaxID=2626932 RepID=UPI0024067B20|nr:MULTISPECIES: ribosome-associated translation inhibitor RaiA [unclassified Ereboglobus]MDF9828113.1 putative sigma-54 modulation protein [Ereboglobus sp. PH5-10]MDF9833057.1 putative sigma-54 modulation protein [Ereboglobus sp. PH5-5]